MTESGSYEYHYAAIRPFGRFMKKVGAARFYINGSGTYCLLTWWHPLAWPVVILTLIFGILAYGLPEVFDPKWQAANELRIDPYYSERSIKPHWL